MKAIQNTKVDQALDDMDWWVDQAILQLQFLEEQYPERQLEETLIQGMDGTLRMKRIYRDIARFRNENQRRHIVPLNSQQLEMIEKFVGKYK